MTQNILEAILYWRMLDVSQDILLFESIQDMKSKSNSPVCESNAIEFIIQYNNYANNAFQVEFYWLKFI